MDNNQDNAPDESSAAAPAAPVEDPLKNVKSEFDRKLSNVNETLSSVMQRLEAMAQPAAAPATDDKKRLADLMFSDPEAYTAEIERRAVERARKESREEVSQITRQQSAIQSTVADLHSKYPELGDVNGEAYKLAVEKANQLPASMRGTPEGIKIALLETVSELGLVPQNKRKAAPAKNDDFSLSGSGSGSAPKRQSAAKDLDPKTVQIAALMGMNVDDPKVIERLKSRVKGARS